jgi:bacterioferritin (cytochrome b1)
MTILAPAFGDIKKAMDDYVDALAKHENHFDLFAQKEAAFKKIGVALYGQEAWQLMTEDHG